MSKTFYTILVLINMCLWKTVDIIENNHFEHTNHDGTTLEKRQEQLGYQGWIGEILYKGPCDIRNAIKLWNESPDHKAILDKKGKYGVFIIVPAGEDSDVCYIIGEYSK